MDLNKGFSLIELLVVVIIISILAAFAYPSYMEYVKRTKREDVKSQLLRIAQDLQSYRVINHTYSSAVLETDSTPLEMDYPAKLPLYTIKLDANDQTYVLIATPKTGKPQANDGVIMMNQQGQKCFGKKSSTVCTLDATSTWNVREP